MARAENERSQARTVSPRFQAEKIRHGCDELLTPFDEGPVAAIFEDDETGASNAPMKLLTQLEEDDAVLVAVDDEDRETNCPQFRSQIVGLDLDFFGPPEAFRGESHPWHK